MHPESDASSTATQLSCSTLVDSRSLTQEEQDPVEDREEEPEETAAAKTACSSSTTSFENLVNGSNKQISRTEDKIHLESDPASNLFVPSDSNNNDVGDPSASLSMELKAEDVLESQEDAGKSA